MKTKSKKINLQRGRTGLRHSHIPGKNRKQQMRDEHNQSSCKARALFSGKNVQIVFAAHSPIVLSDMLQNNVIYLTRYARACLKNHSRDLHSPLCGEFIPNLINIARYAS